MKLKLLTLALLSTLALAACGGAAATEAPALVEAPAFDNAGFAAPPAPPSSGDGTGSTVVSTNSERLVIRNASLAIVVDDSTATVDSITRMAEGMGGFVVSLNTYQITYSAGTEIRPAQQASMTIRVPSERLNDALGQIKDMAVEVQTENISGQDVTAEYTDLKSRLKNLEAAENQLQSIMQEATKTEDVLKVYNQLVATREQIEVIKGQIKYYEESAAMSAITLDIIPNVATQPIEIGGWRPEGTAKESIETLVRILQALIDFLIRFTIVCGPFIIALGVPAFVVGRILWRRAKQNSRKLEK